jgi:hypothetical protein
MYNTKTRSDPVDLLVDYITIIKRVPKFLRVDDAKFFVGAKMKVFCQVHILPWCYWYYQAAFSHCSFDCQCPNTFLVVCYYGFR